MRLRPRPLVFALLCCVSSCSADRGPLVGSVDVVTDERPLVGGLDSLDAVGRAVVEGLNAGDARGLMQLLLSEADFSGRLFDELSNHPNARQMGPELIYTMQQQQSEDEMTRALEAFGRRGLRLVSVEPGTIENLAGVTLYRRPRLRVEDARGAALVLELLGTIVEHRPSSTFKILGYRFRG
jgi:hypothetical protein